MNQLVATVAFLAYSSTVLATPFKQEYIGYTDVKTNAKYAVSANHFDYMSVGFINSSCLLNDTRAYEIKPSNTDGISTHVVLEPRELTHKASDWEHNDLSYGLDNAKKAYFDSNDFIVGYSSYMSCKSVHVCLYVRCKGACKNANNQLLDQLWERSKSNKCNGNWAELKRGNEKCECGIYYTWGRAGSPCANTDDKKKLGKWSDIPYAGDMNWEEI